MQVAWKLYISWMLNRWVISSDLQTRHVSSLGWILLVFTPGLRTMPGRPSARMLRIARCRYFAGRDTRPEMGRLDFPTVLLTIQGVNRCQTINRIPIISIERDVQYRWVHYAVISNQNLAQRLFTWNLFASRTCMQSPITWLHAASANRRRAKWPLLQAAKCRRKDGVQHGSTWWSRKGLQNLRPWPTQLQTKPSEVMLQLCSLSSKAR